MSQRILIMGLPGAGKTYLAQHLVDRLLHGHVIDFVDLHFGSYIYPTFNVADSGICVGVILYLWQSLRAPQ